MNEELLVEIRNLKAVIEDLKEKYASLLLDIKRLEEDEVETSNCLYQIENRIDALEGYRNIPDRY
jgi:predicted nuclease with TOPRIM domain